jgi:transcriptional regulator with XRE-family HTH domain
MSYDTKKILWANVLALMERRYGKENQKRFARDAGISTGTITRIKEQKTSIGIRELEQIARKFKVPPGALLLPNLDKDLLTIVEAYSVAPEIRHYLLVQARAAIEKHASEKMAASDGT